VRVVTRKFSPRQPGVSDWEDFARIGKRSHRGDDGGLFRVRIFPAAQARQPADVL